MTQRKILFYLVISTQILKQFIFFLESETNYYGFLTKGHFGSGKTMLGVEAAKIKMARFLEKKEEVIVYVATFNKSQLIGHSFNYKLLNEEFKGKYFQDQDENNVKISHWTDFISDFAQSQENENTKDKRIILKSVKSVLMTIGEVMEKYNKKVIIMIDELSIEHSCIKSSRNYEANFSCLSQYKNVHFIICLRPHVTIYTYEGIDFELIMPNKQQNQLYKTLKLRHRNNHMILKFLRFWQHQNFAKFLRDDGLTRAWVINPRITHETILDSKYLPPLLQGMEHGVIWIDITSLNKTKSFTSIVSEIFQNLPEIPSVAIIYHGTADLLSTLCTDEFKIAKKLKETNKGFLGPYQEIDFNGKEAEVIIYVSQPQDIELHALSRARRLLILVTPIYLYKDEKILNEAVKLNLVKKIPNHRPDHQKLNEKNRPKRRTVSE